VSVRPISASIDNSVAQTCSQIAILVPEVVREGATYVVAVPASESESDSEVDDDAAFILSPSLIPIFEYYAPMLLCVHTE
jgi:hypothetical protein